MGSHEKAWQELHGSKQWEGLLEPLNEGLREIILRYGDLCQATYDAFNSDPHSKYCGSSRCGKRSFFTKVGLAPPHVSNTAESSDAASGTDYRVAGFLYGTAKIDIPASFLLHSLSREAWSRESNWIGYVAISSDTFSQNLGRRDIVVAYRGTIRDLEWMNVFSPSLESIASLLPPSEDFDDDSPLKHRFERFLGRGEDDDEPKVMDGWYTI
ncbi:hypothetical protein AMTR_s00064p00160580 [Amborella trichopoda]|uniref:Phospholipase A1 n=3 Tax=Amborella trichopoda TaxID=13333 RepID=U5DBB0_AMBTC|nr:hypothetical protein AMTR_s00064p00160580 [Amborella trichopoda]